MTVCNNNYHKKSYCLFISCITMAVLLLSCLGGNNIPEETPTRGDIKIIVDESFQPVISAEISTFTAIYTNAKITPSYKPEYDVINDFMHDSAKVIVSSKKLTDDQIQYLRDSLIVARTTAFAYDALALITNKKNHDTLIKYDEIKDIFTGKAVRWTDLDSKSKLGDIKVIFDNTKSGNIRYFKEKFDISDKLPGNFFAVNSNIEVIDFVSRNTDALGIISVNWISDKNDPTYMSFTKGINVIAVSRPFIDENSYYRPYQGSIAEKSYPFVRDVYLISRETFKGLGSGFIQWATAEQGQRIVLKAGIVPATMPVRLVKIKRE